MKRDIYEHPIAEELGAISCERLCGVWSNHPVGGGNEEIIIIPGGGVDW